MVPLENPNSVKYVVGKMWCNHENHWICKIKSSVVVVYGHNDIWKSFSIIQFGGIYIIFLVQQQWKIFSANYTIIFLSHLFGIDFYWNMYLVWPTAIQIHKICQQKEHQELSYSTWNTTLHQLANLDCSCHFLPQFLSKQKLLQDSVLKTL